MLWQRALFEGKKFERKATISSYFDGTSTVSVVCRLCLTVAAVWYGSTLASMWTCSSLHHRHHGKCSQWVWVGLAEVSYASSSMVVFDMAGRLKLYCELRQHAKLQYSKWANYRWGTFIYYLIDAYDIKPKCRSDFFKRCRITAFRGASHLQ
jgi:cytochrome bd-type quinol oxidase subunit 2